MAFTYLNNIEIEEAERLFINEIRSREITVSTETIPSRESAGRITAKAVYAKISSPHYNASAMDGIAILSKSTAGATNTTPVYLKEDDDFAWVDTGDPLPERFDAVIMIEDVIQSGEGRVMIVAAASPWQHVRQIGEDICAEEMILPSNTVITPPALGALIAGGALKVEVKKRPVVGIIPTGDEIILPTENPGPGQIAEFNSSIFAAVLSGWGAVPKIYDIVPDNFDAVKSILIKAAKECDLVLINAGSSAGRDDLTAKAVSESGEILVHGVAIKPGKPVILGIVENRPVIGVPGYPVSGIIILESFGRKVIEYYYGSDFQEDNMVKVILSRKLVSSLKYKEYVRVKIGDVDGRLIAVPLNRGAGVITSFLKADGILEIPLNSEGYEAGEEVNVRLLKSMEDIRSSIIISGSHDPLIDVIADIMRKHFPGEYVSSAHIGSLGGVMAVKRGEAHAAGVHLLDEATGEYNSSYINKYLKDEKISLIKCVKRTQGFITALGNPKNIKNIKDIAGGNIKFVSRQKGSGTRILLDYMLKKDNLNAENIYGYEREEFTHLGVAALIAAGSADVGLGIYSAAKAYGLGFVPVCEEEYDFIVPEKFLGIKTVKHFIEIIHSEEFKVRLSQMGGYTFY